MGAEKLICSGREYSTLHRSLEHDKLRDSKQIRMAIVYGAAVNVSSKRIEKKGTHSELPPRSRFWGMASSEKEFVILDHRNCGRALIWALPQFR
jgi:hypothetical protein